MATADGCGAAEIMRRSGKSKPVVLKEAETCGLIAKLAVSSKSTNYKVDPGRRIKTHQRSVAYRVAGNRSIVGNATRLRFGAPVLRHGKRLQQLKRLAASLRLTTKLCKMRTLGVCTGPVRAAAVPACYSVIPVGQPRGISNLTNPPSPQLLVFRREKFRTFLAEVQSFGENRH
jgi:hypothetical protein